LAASFTTDYSAALWIVSQKLANPSLAEELVQKTVFDAVRGRNTSTLKKAPSKMIFGIARNQYPA